MLSKLGGGGGGGGGTLSSSTMVRCALHLSPAQIAPGAHEGWDAAWMVSTLSPSRDPSWAPWVAPEPTRRTVNSAMGARTKARGMMFSIRWCPRDPPGLRGARFVVSRIHGSGLWQPSGQGSMSVKTRENKGGCSAPNRARAELGAGIYAPRKFLREG